MKVIRDPVHGQVRVPKPLLSILDSPPVQRLRYVRQLGFSHLVYPGANHTRFEHSLGTMHLAMKMSEELGLAKEEMLLVAASGLLHDIGHSPYSHATEPIITAYTARSGHQDLASLLVDPAIESGLEQAGIAAGEIDAMVNGTHPLSGIIHGDLDVDRMDYLMRDAHYTGVPYGTVDPDRLMYSTIMTAEGLVLKENGIQSAESLLLARTLMRPAVYFHHVSRIAEAMILQAIQEHLKAVGTGEAATLVGLDDAAFLCTMTSSPSEEARAILERIMSRRLYKRAVYVGQDRVPSAVFSGDPDIAGNRRIAEEIAGVAGVLPEEVLVDIPAFPSEIRMAVKVRNHHDLVPLDELSPQVGTLDATRRGYWRLGVYTPAACRDRVEQAAEEVLHLKKPTRQDKLVFT